jgi:hypothetical protein
MPRFRFIILLICFSAVAQTTKPPSEIYRDVGDAVVLISGAHKSGSGVVISQDGMMVVTNFHVISGEDSVTVRFGNGLEVVTDEVLAADPTRDLAILSLPGHGPKLAQLGDSDRVTPGDPIVVISNPLGLEHSVSSGLISGVRILDGKEALQISAPISPGSSGGPVFDRDGKVIGIATATLIDGQNINLAIPSNAVRDLMRTISIDIILGTGKKPKLATLSPPTRSIPGSNASPSQPATATKPAAYPAWWASAQPEAVLADPVFEDLFWGDREKIMLQIDPKFARMATDKRNIYLWRAETKYLPQGSATRVITWTPGNPTSTTEPSMNPAGLRKSLKADGVTVSAILERPGFFVAHIWITNDTDKPISIDPRTWVLSESRPKKHLLHFEYPSRVSREILMNGLLNSGAVGPQGTSGLFKYTDSIEPDALARRELGSGRSVDGNVYFEIDSTTTEAVLRIFLAGLAYDIPFIVPRH